MKQPEFLSGQEPVTATMINHGHDATTPTMNQASSEEMELVTEDTAKLKQALWRSTLVVSGSILLSKRFRLMGRRPIAPTGS